MFLYWCFLQSCSDIIPTIYQFPNKKPSIPIIQRPHPQQIRLHNVSVEIARRSRTAQNGADAQMLASSNPLGSEQIGAPNAPAISLCGKYSVKSS